MVDQPSHIPGGTTPPGAQARGQAGTQAGTGSRTEDIKAEARHKADQAKDQARRLAEQAKERGRSMLHDQKGNVVSQFGTIAGALRDTARSLDSRDEHTAGRWVNQAADGLDRLADTLERRDIDTLMRQAGDLMRRQPAVFIGGAVAAGFLMSRFLKSSQDRQRGSSGIYDESYEDYQTSYGQGYGDAGTSRTRVDSAPPSRDTGYVTSAHVDPGEVARGRPAVPPTTPSGRRDL